MPIVSGSLGESLDSPPYPTVQTMPHPLVQRAVVLIDVRVLSLHRTELPEREFDLPDHGAFKIEPACEFGDIRDGFY